jgi:hypothetical protein
MTAKDRQGLKFVRVFVRHALRADSDAVGQ